jgi:DNA-binding MarR family transcriptional regulator
VEDSPERRQALTGIEEAFAAFVPAVPARLRRSVAAHGGIDPSDFPVLRWIEAWGPLRLTDLAERIDLDASTVSRRVRDLEGKGLVNRTADADDQRASLIELAPEGRRLLARAREVHRRVLEAALAEWPTTDVQAFGDLLQRFTTALIDLG